jgi:hypothetical protein
MPEHGSDVKQRRVIWKGSTRERDYRLVIDEGELFVESRTSGEHDWLFATPTKEREAMLLILAEFVEKLRE